MRTIGFYDYYGYEVNTVDNNGQIVDSLYLAGNHPLESSQVISAADGLPLSKIIDFCVQTTREIAIENNIAYGGVQERELEY